MSLFSNQDFFSFFQSIVDGPVGQAVLQHAESGNKAGTSRFPQRMEVSHAVDQGVKIAT